MGRGKSSARERENSVMEVNMIKYITHMHKMP